LVESSWIGHLPPSRAACASLARERYIDLGLSLAAAAMSVVSNTKLRPDGLPEMTEEEQAKEVSNTQKMVFGLMTGPRVICSGIAWLVYTFGRRGLYDVNIAVIITMQRGWLYFAVGIFSMMVAWLNSWPMVLKARLMSNNVSNLRSNMALLRPIGAQASEPFVIMEEGGPVGEYNRANRSLFNFNEWALGTVLNVVFAGTVFPFPTMVLVVGIAASRVWHQRTYAQGYGKHAPAFFTFVICNTTLEMLVWLVAWKALSFRAE